MTSWLPGNITQKRSDAIVVNVLGYEDNCELLETLRSFRDNYLKLNKEYIPMLMQYDNIGPIISNNLENQTSQKAK